MSFYYSPIHIETGQVSITTSATLIRPFQTSRTSIAIINHGSVDVYIGDKEVTTSTGILLVGSKGSSIAVDTRAAIYGIVASGTQTISWITDGES